MSAAARTGIYILYTKTPNADVRSDLDDGFLFEVDNGRLNLRFKTFNDLERFADLLNRKAAAYKKATAA